MTSRRNERGAILVTTALLIAALLVIVAIVIDLGVTRSDRRGGQSAVDTSVAAAAQAYKDTQDPVQACEQALAYLRVALATPAFVGEGSTTCATQFGTAACSPATPTSLTATSGDYRAILHHPVLDDSPLMARTSTIGNGGIAGSTNDGEECERFGLQLRKSGKPFFGGIAGATERISTVHAVSLIRSGLENEDVAALLLLERIGCGVLQTSGGGETGAGVYVKASSETVPGIIAADSAGQSSPLGPCTTNNNADGWVIYGTSLPAAGGGGPSITAEAATTASSPPEVIPGIIASYAKSVGGRAGYTAPTGINVAPSNGTINSRSTTDKRYNGVHKQVGKLHDDVDSMTAAPTATAAVISGNTECKGTIPSEKLDATEVFVDCATFEPDINIFKDVTAFYVRGNINIKSNKTLSLPQVQNFFVRGCAVGGCSGGNTYAVAIGNGGSLILNTGETAIPDPVASGVPCAMRRSPKHFNDDGDGDPTDDVLGTTTNTTRFATRGGNITFAGFARMCQTTVYIGENVESYQKRTVEDTGIAPENYPPIAACSAERPCPKDGAAPFAGISFSGGSASADWSAPNQESARLENSALSYEGSYAFEDLALWSETSNGSNIRGQGVNTTTGVFFLPNATFTFTGQGTQAQPLDAQFFVRRLNVSGQGSLVMRPDPANSLEVVVFGNVSLIR